MWQIHQFVGHPHLSLASHLSPKAKKKKDHHIHFFVMVGLEYLVPVIKPSFYDSHAFISFRVIMVGHNRFTNIAPIFNF